MQINLFFLIIGILFTGAGILNLIGLRKGPGRYGKILTLLFFALGVIYLLRAFIS